MRSHLRRPGDQPSPDEEAALEKMRLREIARLDQIDASLTVSSVRSRSYSASGDETSLAIERGVQNRLLRERLYVMGEC